MSAVPQSSSLNYSPAPNFSSIGGPAYVPPGGQTPNTSTVNGPVYSPPPATPAPNTSTPQGPTYNAPPSNNGGKDPHINPSTGQWDDNWYQQQVANGKSDAQKQMEAQQAQIRSGIASAYDPIFAELDRQMGVLPQQQADLTGQVNTVANQNKGDVNATNDQQIQALENQKGDETNTYQQSVHGLQDNVKNLLQGASFYLGSLGAGNSSAAEGASAGIINNADKSQGQLSNTYGQALTHIGQAETNVRAVTAKNLNDIDNYKQQQLFDVSQWATNQINQLNASKADASKEEQLSINQMILGTQQQFAQRLQSLDDAVFNYKSAVSLWSQRMAGMLDMQKQAQQAAGSYTSNTAPQYQQILTKDPNGFENLVISNKSNPSDYYTYSPTQGTPTAQAPASNNGVMGFLDNLFSGNNQPAASIQGNQLPTDQSQQYVTK